MTWIKFAFWLFGIYTAYYIVLICWDTFRAKSLPRINEPHELSFVEDIEPIRSVADPVVTGKDSPVASSGGVSLKQLFNLAREESVEYVKAVSF